MFDPVCATSRLPWWPWPCPVPTVAMAPIHCLLAGMPAGVIFWTLRRSSTAAGGRRLKVSVDHHVFMMSVAAKSAMVCDPSTGRLWGLFRHLRLSAILES